MWCVVCVHKKDPASSLGDSPAASVAVSYVNEVVMVVMAVGQSLDRIPFQP